VEDAIVNDYLEEVIVYDRNVTPDCQKDLHPGKLNRYSKILQMTQIHRPVVKVKL